MADPTPIQAAILEAATGPKSAKGDEGEVVARDLRELIEADKYLNQTDAVAAGNAGGGIRFSRLISPGTV